jgi:beta propeller repeat protein
MHETLTRRRASTPTFLLLASVLCVALLLPLILAGTAHAQARGCYPGAYVVDWAAISDGSGAAGAPSTDGAVVVWADNRSGDYNIYAYDLETKVESTVCDSPGDQTDPVVAGGQVFWLDRSGADPAVFTADPDTGQPVLVSAGPAADLAAGDRCVVWTETGAADSNIMAYDMDGGNVFTVCDAPGDQKNPAASGDLIAWEDYRNGSEADIYAYDLRSSGEMPICEAGGDQVTPSVYGSVVVWADDRGGNWDIYGADADKLGNGDGDWSGASAARRCNEHESEFVVCDAEGDQVDPVISGPMAYWTDLSGGEAQADIVGADVTRGDAFVVTDAAGPQTQPAAGDDGGFVAWLDGGGDVPVVAGGRLDWQSGDDGDDPDGVGEWTTDDVVTLFLSVFADLGVFDEVRFAVDDAAFGDWQSLDDTEAVQLPTHDGAHVIHVQLASTEIAAGDPGSEADPLQVDVTTTLDTTGPVTVAPNALKVRRGAKATLRLKVRDALSPRADVRLRIKDRAGRVAKVVKFGECATGKTISRTVTMRLKRGSYTYQVLATDLAGNTQRKAGSNRLIVR